MFSLKKTTYKNLLIGYWLAVPACFYIYLIMTSSMKQVAATDLIINVPGVTLACLMTSLMLIQSVATYFIQQISISRDGLLGKFLSFSMLQQILTGNVVGFLLCFFYKRSLFSEKETATTQHKIIVIIICGLLTIFSLLTLFVAWKLKGG